MVLLISLPGHNNINKYRTRNKLFLFMKEENMKIFKISFHTYMTEVRNLRDRI